MYLNGSLALMSFTLHQVSAVKPTAPGPALSTVGGRGENRVKQMLSHLCFIHVFFFYIYLLNIKEDGSLSVCPPSVQVKMNRMRLRIAQRLKEAQNTCAMLTTFNEVDMR